MAAEVDTVPESAPEPEPEVAAEPEPEPEPEPPVDPAHLRADIEKSIKKKKKKLREITSIKAKEAAGATLEEDQLAKLASHPGIEAELHELEARLRELSV